MSKFLFYDFSIPDLIADGNKAVGGATVQTLNWIKGLIENGHEVGVLVEKKQPGSNNDVITFIETFSLGHNKIFGWIYPRPQELHKAIKSYNPDFIIQAGAGFITFPIALIARINRIPFVHRIANDADVDKRVFRKASFSAVLFYKMGLLLSPILSCQNQYQLDMLSKRFSKKNIFKIHNPFDGQVFKDHHTAKNERHYVAWVGIFQFQKNLPLLLIIAKSLLNVEFRIAGKPRRGIDSALQTILKELESLPNVTFVGFLSRKDLPSFLEKAICLLNTSHYEGFSNTFLESFASGTPVVTTSNVDPDHIIAKFKLGRVSQNFDGLPKTIEELISDQNYSDICERCKRYISENHNHINLANQLNEFLETIRP